MTKFADSGRQQAEEEIERLRAALEEITKLGEDSSAMKYVARAALEKTK